MSGPCALTMSLNIDITFVREGSDVEIREEKDLEMVTGGAAKTETRTAKKESCFCCGHNKFTVYLGQGGRAVCLRCGQGQIILEWFYA